MIYIRKMHMRLMPGPYPFNSQALTNLDTREFASGVTLFVGENGTGKSTLLEALARKLRMPALGAEDTAADSSLCGVEPLAEAISLIWNRRPKQSFFLRAEDFFGFTRRVAAMQAGFREELDRVEREYEGRSKLAKDYAAMPFAGSLYELERRYGIDPDARSHGESYLSVFQTRMRPGGLYLLDEPESALSPTRQMALLSLIYSLADTCQFIIATHSPILMALPGADIWSFDEIPLRSVSWQDLPQVETLRSFLNAPEQYLRHLLG